MKDLLENNKLIAEFMGFEYNEIDYIKKDMIKHGSSSMYTKEESYKYHIPTVFNGFINSYDGYMDFSENSKKENCYNHYVKNMGFHDSYDWLMPVVEKINSFDKHGVVIHFNRTVISTHFKNKINIISSKKDESLINNTYKAVVEFIKWYNKNNKK